MAIPDLLYVATVAIVRRSAAKLRLEGNVVVIRESMAIAVRSTAPSNDAKFMTISLDSECSFSAGFKMVDEFKLKALGQPALLYYVSLRRHVDHTLYVIADIVGDDDFERLTLNDPRKVDAIKLKVVEAIKGRHDDDDDEDGGRGVSN